MSARDGVCLSKWYLDCIGPRGEAWVGYHLELRWKTIALRFAGFTFAPGDTPPQSRLALRRLSTPDVREDAIVWAVPGLELEGRWDATTPRLDAVLFESQAGAVEWRCLQPGSRVRLKARGCAVTGFGYAERLLLTLPPWQLPITGLRWGRFVAEGHALTWIDWEGAHRVRLLAYNGHQVEPGEIGNDRVVSKDGAFQLDLEPHEVLRNAQLGETLGSLLPRRPALPQAVLGLTEQKWVAKGSLRVEGGPPVPGWVIHEQVRWPSSAP